MRRFGRCRVGRRGIFNGNRAGGRRAKRGEEIWVVFGFTVLGIEWEVDLLMLLHFSLLSVRGRNERRERAGSDASFLPPTRSREQERVPFLLLDSDSKASTDHQHSPF